ncbi:sensor histidine kinase [Calothrix sp. 336/3]|uniref:sensor histidine kinase n=1 Tax=Calothrix sp. 336/3 TaxID=1337936 RepID=UPI0004E47078|nr:ATP-binding protein [Calothrix sp. 336/3]AKG21757.1 histidine kinase [Calothrix sp. 336/3]
MPIFRRSNQPNEQPDNPRTGVRGVRLQASYSKLVLSQRIIMPFLLLFFTIMVVTIINYAFWFTSKLEDQASIFVENNATVVLHQLQHEQEHISSWTKLMGERNDIIKAVEQQNIPELFKIITPHKNSLKFNFVKVLNQNGGILLDLTEPEFSQLILEDRQNIVAALNGLNTTDVINLSDSENKKIQSVLVASTPLLSISGEIIGAILTGNMISEDFLRNVNPAQDEYVVIFNSKNQVTTSTLSSVYGERWEVPSLGEKPKRVLIASQHYLGKAIALPSLSYTTMQVVLLKSLGDINHTVQYLWLRLWGFFIIGGLTCTFLGRKIALSISDPLLAVAKVARKVTQESNFDLQVPVTRSDEVGILASSLNSLIRRIAEYTQQLEQSRENLEKRVEERTQQISQKNQELNQAYEQLSEALNELQQTQAQLIQTEKMSSLGNMVAGVAHEINNPINFIYGNLGYARDYTRQMFDLIDLYQREYPQPTVAIAEQLEQTEIEYIKDDLPKILSSMKMGSQRIREIVLSLRNFSRLDEAEMKYVNIHEGIDSTLLILNHRLKENILVFKEYGELSKIECYAAQLNQVFLNIISNAIDALEEESLQNHKELTIHTEKIDEDKITIEIVDNGVGFSPELQDKIFDPFFTTKEVGKGTGLGLWICYQIIQKHHGKIEITSILGQGTRCKITLPCVQNLEAS